MTAQPFDDARPGTITSGLTLLLATACGIVVANIYYVQPIVGPVSRAYGMSLTASGVLVTLTQLGYALGLVFIVPLGDVVENRRLILVLLVLLVGALALSYAAPVAALFLAACLAVGIASSAVQVIVPFAGHLAEDATRGRTVGNVVSGLLFGIMLSRPLASFSAYYLGPRSIFALSAIAAVGLAAVLAAQLPHRQPHGMPYGRMLASLWPLLRDSEVLHRRGAYQAAMFGAFSLFWTVVPLLLEGARFQFTQIGIGIFALVGAGGALISPVAGRLADADHSRVVTGIALAAGAVSFVVAIVAGWLASVPLLIVAALVLDMAVAANLVTGQRAIFALGAEARGRLNGIFLALFLAGGAFGSLVAGIAFAHGGWTAACVVGLIFPVLALLYYVSER